MDLDRADRLLARAWWRARKRLVETEGFLEDALAAALEEPDVWPCLVRHLRWEARVPDTAPSVRTQRIVPGGRVDIRLDWPGCAPLILELKVAGPPDAAQVENYLRHGFLVAAIAGTAAPLALDAQYEGTFLGVRTWQSIRTLPLEPAPLVLRQLHRLLDATEVAMPRIEEDALTGMAASWRAWPAFDAWMAQAIDAVQRRLAEADVRLVKSATLEFAHGRYARWLASDTSRDDTLWVGLGLFVGDEVDAPQHPGFPDLLLTVDTDPDGVLGQRLREDAPFHAAVGAWAEEDSADVRQDRIAQGTWQPIQTRASARLLLDAPDQRQAFVEWLVSAAGAWTQHGTIQRLAQLAAESRLAVDMAPEEEEEAPDPYDASGTSSST